MATTTNLFKRFAVSLKNKKKNPEWARVDEPDTIARPAVFAVFGMLIIAFTVLLAFIVMTTSPVHAVAAFLASLHSSLPFNQLYAAFGAALIVMIDLVVMTLFMLLSPADNDDLVEMISDLDANLQERIVELENSVNEKLEVIRQELGQ